jgi:GTPase SAR1 family protein
MLGNVSVGKTCVVNRFVKDEFEYQQAATIGANYSSKDVIVQHNNSCEQQKVKLLIWDTAGSE